VGGEGEEGEEGEEQGGRHHQQWQGHRQGVAQERACEVNLYRADDIVQAGLFGEIDFK
jgi:hypothetical protein